MSPPPHEFGHSPVAAVGVLLSGGVDSTVLLAELLRSHERVVPLYVRTDCVWQDRELSAVKELLRALARPSLDSLREFDMPMRDLYDGHWSMSGEAVPDKSTSDEAVYLPGRNPLLLIKPALWCRMNGVGALAIATLANNPFDDARPEFFHSFEAMLREATGDNLTILRPFETLSKRHVVELGKELPLERTFSCLAPRNGLHCGRCNKCAERQKALSTQEKGDATEYANR